MKIFPPFAEMLPTALRPAWQATRRFAAPFLAYVATSIGRRPLVTGGAVLVVCAVFGLYSLANPNSSLRRYSALTASAPQQRNTWGTLTVTAAQSQQNCSELIRHPRQPLTVQRPCRLNTSSLASPLNAAPSTSTNSNLPLTRGDKQKRATALTSTDLAIKPPGALRQTIVEKAAPPAQANFKVDESTFALSPPQR